jgi:hypothetical protein
MKKGHMPNTPGFGSRSSGNPSDSSDPAEPHILPQLLALLNQSAPPTVGAKTWSRKARAHLRVCASCRLGLSLLSDALPASPEAETPETPAPAPHRGRPDNPDNPDNTDLALFVALASENGVAMANTLLPEVARHLDTCPSCAARVREELTDADEDDPWRDGSPPPAAPSPTAPPQPSPQIASGRQWLALTSQTGERTDMLLAPYVVAIGDLTLNITSELPNPHVEVEFSDSPAFRDFRASPEPPASPPFSGDWRGDPAPEGEKQEQSFTVDLRDDDATTPWVRVKVHLLPAATGRLIFHLTSYRVSAADEIGVQVGGVQWLLHKAATDGEPALLATGETRPDAPSRASSKERGELRLTLRSNGRDWIVPLVIHPQPENP